MDSFGSLFGWRNEKEWGDGFFPLVGGSRISAAALVLLPRSIFAQPPVPLVMLQPPSVAAPAALLAAPQPLPSARKLKPASRGSRPVLELTEPAACPWGQRRRLCGYALLTTGAGAAGAATSRRLNFHPTVSLHCVDTQN